MDQGVVLMRILYGWAILLVLMPGVVLAQNTDASGTPAIHVPEPAFQFDTVVSGRDVTHDYLLQNRGTAPLKISRVKTAWGCAATSFTREIPPGGEGKVTLKLKTSSYGNSDVKKKAIIHSNDPDKPKVTLTIFGKVEKFVDLKPRYVRLTGRIGDKISVPVTIVPTSKYPFKIKDVKARTGKAIKYSLSERSQAEGGGYNLLVENTRTEKGRYVDVLTLSTDSDIQPQLLVRVYGNIMAPATNKSQKK